MSMVQSTVGMAASTFGTEVPVHDTPLATTRRSSRARLARRAIVRSLSVLICAVSLLTMTAGGTLAAPESTAAESSATYQDGTGSYIADYALQFLGYSYVYGGNTPSGFDCSGFTQYVVQNTLGIDIGHGTAGQLSAGTWVNWGEWQAGDLVYFAGTYRAGISHTGIYIGDGQIVHAANESTGVIVSDLYSNYYSSHYYGAIRVA
ncbi:MAG: C40 family peptidase [Chloroflexia bacterium]|nr:C40 family peptidase [Chloroflexia bacterium]